uniref:Uncharacterized protein n=1 Tax=Romanomermis culicivorax TaxID=13658 RepID=A0A915IYI4_ROMCU
QTLINVPIYSDTKNRLNGDTVAELLFIVYEVNLAIDGSKILEKSMQTQSLTGKNRVRSKSRKFYIDLHGYDSSRLSEYCCNDISMEFCERSTYALNILNTIVT